MRARLSDIITIAARLSAVDEVTLRGPNKWRRLSAIRSAIYVTAKAHGHSYAQIGKEMAGRDHSSIIAVVRAQSSYDETFPNLAGFRDALAHYLATLPPFVSETRWQPPVYFVFPIRQMEAEFVRRGQVAVAA